MACVRRTLTTTSTHLSRHLLPSFSHALPADRDEPLRPPPLPAPNLARPAHTFTRLGLPLPLGLAPFSNRFHSSSAPSGGSAEIGIIRDDAAGTFADATLDEAASAVPLPFPGEVAAGTFADAALDAAASAVPLQFPGEVAAAAADSYLPVAALQYLIDGVHSFTGTNWWVSIILTTILIRGVTTPLLLNQMRSSVKLGKMQPELVELKAQIDNYMDPESIQEGQKRMKALFEKHGVTPFTPLKGMFIQAPIFISFFLAISNMVEKVPSLRGGGAFWFTDLTTPDPLYALPVLTALSFLATVELNMQEGMEGNPMAKNMKNVSRGFALMTIPLTAHFPKAIFCYWITSNIFSLTYGFVIRRPSVRKFLNLPDIVPQPTNPAPQLNFPFFGGPKPNAATFPLLPTKEPEQVKSKERRESSSSAISKRIRNLEKTVKSRSKVKPKKR